MEQINRREMLKAAGAVIAMSGLGGLAFAQTTAPIAKPQTRRRTLRVAHLTDIHIQPERKAGDGMIMCLHHVQNLKDKPDLILTGGDSVYDSFEADNARTQLQWDLWNSVFRNECSIPVQSCIGNHDVWGWHKRNSKTSGDEPNYGKKRAMENLHLSERYRSFDPPGCGWHFIALDGIQPDGNGYMAFLDEEEFDWLQRELAATDPKTPVLVFSHIPILSISAMLWASQDKTGDFKIEGSLVHTDAVRIKDLLAKFPNVKLCLSGHLHLLDRTEYNGVTYLCNGAVSGNWWKGRHKDCDEGYAVIDLYDDGLFEREYVTYGWKAAT